MIPTIIDYSLENKDAEIHLCVLLTLFNIQYTKDKNHWQHASKESDLTIPILMDFLCFFSIVEGESTTYVNLNLILALNSRHLTEVYVEYYTESGVRTSLFSHFIF